MAAVGVAGVVATPSEAAVIQLNAESGVLGSTFETVPFTGAIGGNIIRGTVDDGGGAPDVPGGAVATYSVNFPEAGEYDLYVRWAIPADDNFDSVFVSNGFGSTPLAADSADTTANGGWSLQNSLALGKTKLADMPTEGGTRAVASTFPADSLIWNNFSAVFEDNAVAGQSTNSDEDVPTFVVAAPGVLTYQIAHRESGFPIDAIAFAPTSERGTLTVDSGGNLVAVPEPTCLALLGLSGMALLGRKRRGGQ